MAARRLDYTSTQLFTLETVYTKTNKTGAMGNVSGWASQPKDFEV